jgi:hypothetical protein
MPVTLTRTAAATATGGGAVSSAAKRLAETPRRIETITQLEEVMAEMFMGGSLRKAQPEFKRGRWERVAVGPGEGILRTASRLLPVDDSWVAESAWPPQSYIRNAQRSTLNVQPPQPLNVEC